MSGCQILLAFIRDTLGIRHELYDGKTYGPHRGTDSEPLAFVDLSYHIYDSAEC